MARWWPPAGRHAGAGLVFLSAWAAALRCVKSDSLHRSLNKISTGQSTYLNLHLPARSFVRQPLACDDAARLCPTPARPPSAADLAAGRRSLSVQVRKLYIGKREVGFGLKTKMVVGVDRAVEFFVTIIHPPFTRSHTALHRNWMRLWAWTPPYCRPY